MRTPSNRFRLPLAVGILLTASLTAGCGDAGPSQPSVVLIVIDTLRHDHLGCYGYERDTSPEIDSLAADGVLIERAYATAPWTLPSMASIFTGLYPASHGTTTLDSKLPSNLTTLAERLREGGYATAGVVSHTLLLPKHGYHQGFDQYFSEYLPNPFGTASSEKVTRRAQSLLREFAGQDRPFFLFAHYFDPHYNYLRHPMFGFAASSVGRLKPGDNVESLYDMAQDLTPDEVQFLIDLYDEEIRYTDMQIGVLLSTIRELDLFDDTLIVITADHGEEFVDHGNLGHTSTLYEEVIRVPLILRLPAGRSGGRVVEGPISLVSLTPTILDLVGIQFSEGDFQAGSFASALSIDEAPITNSMYSEIDFAEHEVKKRSLLVGGLKIIRDLKTGGIELYDLRQDPLEQNDLALHSPEVVRDLLPQLDRQIKLAGLKSVDFDEMTLSEKELEELRSLGYLRR